MLTTNEGQKERERVEKLKARDQKRRKQTTTPKKLIILFSDDGDMDDKA